MNFWNTIKKDENWAWVDTDKRQLAEFNESKFLDLSWTKSNILDRSMKNNLILFHTGIPLSN